jgi:hypothetical protein
MTDFTFEVHYGGLSCLYNCSCFDMYIPFHLDALNALCYLSVVFLFYVSVCLFFYTPCAVFSDMSMDGYTPSGAVCAVDWNIQGKCSFFYSFFSDLEPNCVPILLYFPF